MGNRGRRSGGLCHGAPRTGGRPPTAAAPKEVIACLTEELEQLGYEVTRLEAAAVEVSAARDRDSPWILELLGFRSTGDRIAVFVGPDELRVSALAADDSGTRIQGFGTMTESQRQVERVVTACAELRSEASSGSGANGEKSPSDVQAP